MILVQRSMFSCIDAEGNCSSAVTGASLGLGVFPEVTAVLLQHMYSIAGSTLKDHWDEAITHTGRIVSIALILTKQ